MEFLQLFRRSRSVKGYVLKYTQSVHNLLKIMENSSNVLLIWVIAKKDATKDDSVLSNWDWLSSEQLIMVYWSKLLWIDNGSQ